MYNKYEKICNYIYLHTWTEMKKISKWDDENTMNTALRFEWMIENMRETKLEYEDLFLVVKTLTNPDRSQGWKLYNYM